MFPFYTADGEPIGPHRVWHPKFAFPGLAMSRSLGDYIAHQFGVIADPEISEYEIKPEDRYFVLASDGVWEFLSNQEVADILSIGIDRGDYSKALDDLIENAHYEWTVNDNAIDDIT